MLTAAKKKCLNLWIFSLPLKLEIYGIGNSLSNDESHPYFIFPLKLSKHTLGFIDELVNLNYTLKILFYKSPIIRNGASI